MIPPDIWCSVIRFTSMEDYPHISLVCKNARNGLRRFLRIYFGTINTWASDCPPSIHKWRCLQQDCPPMNIYAPYPNAFSDPASTLLPPVSYAPALPSLIIKDWLPITCKSKKRRRRRKRNKTPKA